MPPTTDRTLLRVHRCRAGYRGTAVTPALDLEIAAGECVALLGVNGAGKTTLLRAVLGLADVVEGELHVLAGPVGYVPQRHTGAPGVPATVREVVAAGRLLQRGPLARWRAAQRREDRRAVAAALRDVGLGELAETPWGLLSGGQQRRALLARALASGARLLLLDEPTAGVDVASQRLLVAALRRVVADGAAVLVVTHELDAVAAALTRALTLTRAGLEPAPLTPRTSSTLADPPPADPPTAAPAAQPVLTPRHGGAA
ncbi:metal ABC transporter ATP-binding protein [Kineococcus sp. SYSU DK005]|uniref:metal ABC transporter ATP-binding protein n=1 Tax=Kineococcus sp. SYSU DK005 TaxID=3383126 RepID=UPI003D7E5A91